MKYKPLRIIGYENYQVVEDEYLKRIEGFSTIVTDLNIFPYSVQKQVRVTSNNYPLFCVLLPSMVKKIEDVMLNSKKIEALKIKVPTVAEKKLILSLLKNEVQSTNEIEGVKSTRKEIEEVIQNTKKKKQLRFDGIVNMYLEIIQKKGTQIDDVNRIREIYDDLVSEEIDDKNKLDGEIFRAESVVIKENDERAVHQGNPNESSIIADLQKLIVFMNDSDLPSVVKAIITHYFFEYIHPFYDGNGRVGRFLLSSYLAKKLDIYTSLSISDSVYRNKKKYENAFSEVSHPKNKGEVTFFVLEILDIILAAQENIKEELNTLIKKLKNARSYIDSLGYSEIEASVLYIYAQNHLFEREGSFISNKEIHDIVKARKRISRNKINSMIENFEKDGILNKIGSNPIVYKYSNDILEILE